jgi:heme/copper-type cytochrome/quinol oxidase subunit 4
MDSFYIVDIPNKEYIELINDICRMVIIQITIQFLFYINNNPGENNFLTTEFVLLVIYVALAVALYWLVFKRIVVFK